MRAGLEIFLIVSLALVATGFAFRPPAVPLVMGDPYFNVWSMADQLTDEDTRMWNGQNKTMVGLIRVNGNCYRWMGSAWNAPSNCQTALPQISVTVNYSTSTYFFMHGNTALTVSFTSYFNALDLLSISLPLTYVTFTINSPGDDVQVYFDAAADFATYTANEPMVWNRNVFGEVSAMRVGTQAQQVLARSGDWVAIDWGYFYVATVEDSTASTVMAAGAVSRSQFASNGSLPSADDLRMPRPITDQMPALAVAWNLTASVPQSNTYTRSVMLAYDDIASIDWFGTFLPPYWRMVFGSNTGAMLQHAAAQEDSVLLAAGQMDAMLSEETMAKAGGEYTTLTALAYRQVFAACKLVWNPSEATAWYFMKEISSDGDLSTVDVVFPASPIFLWLNPQLLAMQMLPIFPYATAEVPSGYNKTWAPHHLGIYPIGGPISQEDMPVEETSNLILMSAAIVQRNGADVSFFFPHYMPLFRQWAQYLVANLPDTGDQLCTDDFEGPSPHNANLAAKGIVALAAYSYLCEVVGLSTEAQQYAAIVSNYTAAWVSMAQTTVNGTQPLHYKLEYDIINSWSLKYNIMYQSILGFSVFNDSVIENESDFYLGNMASYGIPLDSRGPLTKLDWQFWVAAMTHSPALQQKLISVLYNWASTTPTRVPLTDFYDTNSGAQLGFQARPVVGGLFSLMLTEL